jgi:hemolysin activation/secretion protein
LPRGIKFHLVGSDAVRMLALAIIAMAAAAQAKAQTGAGQIAPPASPIPRVEPPPQPSVTPPRVQETPEIPVQAGPPVHVVSIEVDGATVYTAAELQALLRGLQDATVPRTQIAEAVRDIQTKYRRDGYFLTVVRGVLDPVPGGARLRIRVTEGYINSIKLEGDVGAVETLIYRYLVHLIDIRPIRITDVERYALLAENVSGMTVRTILRAAGTEPGAIDLVAQVQRKQFDGLMTDDNRGPQTAGPNELLVSAASNSFTSLGERFQATIYDTPLNDHQVFGQASLEGFVGSEGLKLKAYAGMGQSHPGGVLAAIGYASDLLEFGASAAYPVIRTRALSLSLSAAFDIEESIIDVLGGDNQPHPTSKTNLRVVRLGQTLDVQDDIFGGGRAAANSVGFTVHRGIPELGGQKNNAVFVPRPGVKNNFTKFSTEITRVQNLVAWDTYSLALKLAFAGQATPDILPPIEKFFLGGEQYGRGFFSGEVTGDNAAAGTVELQLNDTFQGQVFGYAYDVGTQYYCFYDVGQTWSNATGDLKQHIESAGVGVRANLTPRLAVQVEGVNRFTRRPTATVGSLETQYAAYFRIIARF